MVNSAGTRRIRSWRGGGPPIAATTAFSWPTSTCTSVALHVLMIHAVLLIISSSTSSFSSACSHVDRRPRLDQQQHERFINILEENVAIKVQVAVVQDLSHLDASTSARKLNTHHIEQQQSITTELQQSKDLANHHAIPGANHPKLHSTSSSSYSLSFKKEAAQGWRTFIHRSKWRRQPSHDIILHQPGRVLGPPHNLTALNQKFNMLETHVITTSNLLLEFITKIWKSAMWKIMVRDHHHHHHHHKTRPSSSQPAVVVTAQRQVVRVRRKLLSIKGTEDSNSSTKFSHSSSTSSSSSSSFSDDFFDDYRDPETHPPKSN